MNSEFTCRRCGASVPADVLAGLCPRCVAKVTLAAASAVDADSQDPSSQAVEPSPHEPPSRLRYFGDYELIEEIGRGGMGVVYKARQVSLNRYVAVKMLLHGDFASPEFVQRFRAEAEAAAGLQHPNIVAIHEIGAHEGQQYFSMDYVEGPNLATRVGNEPLPADQAARFARTLAEATHYAHLHGVLHRDLKPSNVLVDARNEPRITDFGLAKRLNDSPPSSLDPHLTLPGQILGAPSYMPPEQAAGAQGEIGVPSDVYALGAILYHLLTGQPPFLAKTVADTLAQVQSQEPIPPRALLPAIPRDLETICLKCLRKHPRDRYPTAAALADDLRRWLDGEPILARPLSPLEAAWRVCRRHPALATLGAVAVSGALATLLFWPRPPPLRIPPQVTELIVLADNNESPAPLYVTDPSGILWHRLPLRQVSIFDVSPNGRHLGYLRQDGPGAASLWISRLDGTHRQRIVARAGAPWWLDDRTLLYQAPDLLSLWAVDITTRQTRKLFDWSAVTTNGCAADVACSPDRKRLLVSVQNRVFHPERHELVLYSPTADLFVCDLDGRNVRTIWDDGDTLTNCTTDTRIVWVDSDRVAWCRHAHPGNRVQDMAIVTCRFGETNLNSLTPWRGYNYPLAPSPDGRRILFATEDAPGGGNLELWSMNSDGSDRRRVLDRKFGCDLGFVARWFRRPE